MASSEAAPTGPPRSSIVVRRVAETEWASVRRLRLRALATDPVAFGSTAMHESQWTDSKWVEWVREGAAAPTAALWVAAQEDGSLVGLVGLHAEEEGLRLRGLWVEPAFRGQGLGAELVDAVLLWADTAHPARAVTLSVNPTHEQAVRLFRNRGFEATKLVHPLGHTPGETGQEMVRKPAAPSAPDRS